MGSKIHHQSSQKFGVGSSNVIKNITNEVMRNCAKDDIIVQENVISLAVRLLSLDPSYGLRLDSHYDRRALEEFVFKCVMKFKGLPFYRLDYQKLLASFTLFVCRLRKFLRKNTKHASFLYGPLHRRGTHNQLSHGTVDRQNIGVNSRDNYRLI